MKNRKSKSIPHLTPDQLCLAIMDQLAGLVDFYDHPKTHDLHEVAASAYGAAASAMYGRIEELARERRRRRDRKRRRSNR